MKSIDQFTLKKEKSNIQRAKFNSSKEVYQYVKQFYSDDIDIQESFFTLFLDKKNETIGFAKISQGGISACIVESRLIVKYAIECLATSVILIHNHPSGQLKASEQDIATTNKLKQCLGMFDVRILDHIIVTSESFYSFADMEVMTL